MKPSAVAMARNLGLASMILTFATAGFASYVHESAPTSALVLPSVVVAVGSFALWAACGLFLWFKLWAWLIASWPTRGNLKNLAWSLFIMAGSIIVPLFVHRLLAAPYVPAGRGGVP